MAYSELPWRPFLGHRAWSWTTLRRGKVLQTFFKFFCHVFTFLTFFYIFIWTFFTSMPKSSKRFFVPAHVSRHPKRHLDQLIRFAWLTDVSTRNTHTHTDHGTSTIIGRVYVCVHPLDGTGSNMFSDCPCICACGIRRNFQINSEQYWLTTFAAWSSAPRGISWSAAAPLWLVAGWVTWRSGFLEEEQVRGRGLDRVVDGRRRLRRVLATDVHHPVSGARVADAGPLNIHQNVYINGAPHSSASAWHAHHTQWTVNFRDFGGARVDPGEVDVGCLLTFLLN